jgi:hypothetical protein
VTAIAGEDEDVPLGVRSEVKVRGGTSQASHGRGNNEGEEDRDGEDDVGIEGLTIVLHLKGKDDLVISADLTRGGGLA